MTIKNSAIAKALFQHLGMEGLTMLAREVLEADSSESRHDVVTHIVAVTLFSSRPQIGSNICLHKVVKELGYLGVDTGSYLKRVGELNQVKREIAIMEWSLVEVMGRRKC